MAGYPGNEEAAEAVCEGEVEGAEAEGALDEL